MYHFSLYISFLHVRRSCLAYRQVPHTHVPHMRHTRLPRTKTKVQSKVQLPGEMVSVHEDVKPIGVGESIDMQIILKLVFRHKALNIDFE